MAAIGLTGFFGMRKMRDKQTRQSLPFCVSQLVSWTIIGVFFFSGVWSVMYFVTIAAIYIPMIVWILRLPKDDHAA